MELRNVEDGPDAWKLAVDDIESNSYTVSELKHEDEAVSYTHLTLPTILLV